MFGLMQDKPLLISSLLEHAERFHPHAEIVSKTVAGAIHRYTWRDLARRTRCLAEALKVRGVRQGSVVATLAWNTHRHLELYFAVMGMGAVLHTVNPRLSSEHLEYILNHGDAEFLFFDTSFTAIVETLQSRLPRVRTFVSMTSENECAASAPKIRNLECYELLIDVKSGTPDFAWPSFDENSASSLCYTSGTTGNPKGVLYSHRSTILHSLAIGSPDAFCISADTAMLVVVPLFHVNAWGLPFCAAMTGAKLVLPGPHLYGKSIYELLRDERVTLAAGVPTVWQMLFGHVDENKLQPKEELCLKTAVVGGSAAPRTMIERFDRDFGTFLLHAWGMTEMSPLGVICRLLPKHGKLTTEQRYDLQMKQGRPTWGVQLKIVDEAGKRLPHDGESRGHVMVGGPWIVKEYFKGDAGPLLDSDGYFDTGDIGVIDDDGYLTLVDRAKDVIKSGGEWISSIALENAAIGCPGIAMAAVIGAEHSKWQERPLMLCVSQPDTQVEKATVLDYLETKVPKWWLPDDVVFVDALPLTATGKLNKLMLRQQYGKHLIACEEFGATSAA